MNLKNSTAGAFRRLLKPLSKVIHLRNLVGDFSVSEWQSIVVRSGVNTVRLLLLDFAHWSVGNARRNLAEAVSMTDLSRLVAGREFSLRRFNRLIGNIEQVDAVLAQELLTRLDEGQLALSFAQANAEDMAYFVWKSERLDPVSANRIISSTASNVLAKLICEWSPHSLWLLWNVYRVNMEKAEDVAKMVWEELRPKTFTFAGTPAAQLAFLGLIHFCKIEVKSSIDLLADRDALVQALDNEESPTICMLSLRGLKAILDSEEFIKIVGTINVERIRKLVDNQSDKRLRDLLHRLLGNILLENEI